MYSSAGRGMALLVFIFASCFISSVNAEDKPSLTTNILFSVQPQQCVTLRQGRDCFTTVKIQWQKQTEQALCLYQVTNKQAKNKEQLMCWSKSNKGQTSVEFESNDNLTYQLRTLKDDHLLAETEIVVSWLHKNTTRSRRWRLF